MRKRIALLSLIGGFLTPELVSSGKDEQVVLFSYLLILGAGLLVIELRRNWRSLTPVSFVLSMIYFWGWYDRFYQPEKLERTLLFATLLFILYAALPVVRAIRFSGLNPLDILVVLVNAAAYFGALCTMLWPQDRWPLTLFVLALSGAYLFITSIVPHPKPGESPLAPIDFRGAGADFCDAGHSDSAGRKVDQHVVFRGRRRVDLDRSACKGVVLANRRASAARHCWISSAGFPAVRAGFFVERALRGLFCTGDLSCGRALCDWPAFGRASREGDVSVWSVRGGLNVYALIALSLELWDYFGRQTGLGIDSSLAQHLSLSLLWTAYASVLIALGIQRKSALLRWQALALFGTVVIKVFIYDSSYLERFYRIVSFLMLGLVLLAVSFLYQRKIARGRTP